MQTPSKCSLITDPSRPRVSPESSAIILKCILHGEPKKLNLSYTSGIQGRDGEEWVEFSADGYRMAAFVRDKSVTNLFLAISPKNSEYYLPSEGGNVFSHLSHKEQQQLTELLIGPHSGKDHGVEMVPAWIIAIQGARPYLGGHAYYHKEDAEKALIEQRHHFELYQQKLKDAPPEPTKVKAPPIAFSKRVKKGKK